MSIQISKQYNNRKVLLVPNLGEVPIFTAKEIFTRQNLKPFLMICTSNGGKTVIGIDIYKACAQAGYDQFNYITTTYNSGENTYLKNNVLPHTVIDQHIIQRTIHLLEKCKKEQKSEENLNLLNIAQSYFNENDKQIYNQIEKDYINQINCLVDIEQFIQDVFTTNAIQATNYIQEILQQKEIKQIYGKSQALKSSLIKLIPDGADEFKITVNNQIVTKIKAINQWIDDIKQITDKYKNDINTLCQNVLKKKCDEIISEKRKLLIDWYQNGKCDNQQLNTLLPLVQQKRRICLIMDDLQSILPIAQNSTQKVIVDGKPIKESVAFASLFTSIFTEGRHLGTIFVALHTANAYKNIATTLQNVTNLIINNGSELNTTQSLFIKRQPFASIVPQIMEVMNKYNIQNKTHYNLICYNDITQSPHPDCQCILYQAEYTDTQEFNTTIYENTPFYYYLAKKYAKSQGINVKKQIEQQHQLQELVKEVQSDKSYDYEEEYEYEEVSEDQ